MIRQNMTQSSERGIEPVTPRRCGERAVVAAGHARWRVTVDMGRRSKHRRPGRGARPDRRGPLAGRRGRGPRRAGFGGHAGAGASHRSDPVRGWGTGGGVPAPTRRRAKALREHRSRLALGGVEVHQPADAGLLRRFGSGAGWDRPVWRADGEARRRAHRRGRTGERRPLIGDATLTRRRRCVP